LVGELSCNWSEVLAEKNERHSYEVNVHCDALESGFILSNMSPACLGLDPGHPAGIRRAPDHFWFTGVQFDPELKIVRPAPALRQFHRSGSEAASWLETLFLQIIGTLRLL
jgi:CTP synthase (UTP-ammonia lyase)